MKSLGLAVSVVLLAGCSSGLQEVAFQQDDGTYVVSRSLVNSRVTANQPHAQGVFVCRDRLSSELMALFRQRDGAVIDHSWYANCVPATDYTATSDQSILTQASGPIEAVVIGAAVGTGLAMSGDTITQRGGGGVAISGSSASSSIKQKNVTKKRR